MSVNDWLTPETAIGARLPCGATVARATVAHDGAIGVEFDREPLMKNGVPAGSKGAWWFHPNGKALGLFPDFTPPVAAPQPEGVYVTRQMLAPVVQALTNATKRLCVHPTETNDAKQLVINCDKGLAHVVRALEAIDALGIPPAPAAEPQPEGVWVTREALFAAIVSVGGLYAKPMYALADALGMPPAPPKVAPSEAAYEAWVNSLPDVYPRSAWQAAWAACEQHYNIETGGEA
jgi:hypothetical protein